MRHATVLLFLTALTTTAPAADVPADWAFQPVRTPVVPAVRQPAAVRTAVDAFLLTELEKRNLTFSPEADRATLIRRLSFDLAGLPPPPEEIDAFLNDSSADAYEKLVERLLTSPRYGERQATWWLDLVRYAESDGFKADDPRPSAWRSRDYVTRSFH